MREMPLFVKATYALIFVIALGFFLIVTREFLYPIAISILLSFLLYPVVRFLEKRGLTRILAILITILLTIFFVGLLIYVFYSRLSFFLADLPEMKERAIQNIENLENAIESFTGMRTTPDNNWLRNEISSFFDNKSVLIRSAITATSSTFIKIALMPVYIFFMLYYRDKFREFILKLIPDKQHGNTRLIIDAVSVVTKKYVTGVMTVVAILCVLNSIGLLIVGLQYAVLFGIISAFLNVIPYFGTLIGGAVPLIYALISEGSPEKAFGVVILFIIIQFTENNILTPNITGGQVRINPFFTILSIIIGGMLWGLPGMIVSVPFLGMLKIVCDHVEKLYPLGFLLSTHGTAKHAITWPRIKGFLTGKKVKIKEVDSKYDDIPPPV